MLCTPKYLQSKQDKLKNTNRNVVTCKHHSVRVCIKT